MLPVPAGRWSFPTLSPRVFPWMLGPLSRRFVRCSYPFLPPQHRPSLTYHRSALPQFPTQTTSEWKAFRDCSHFIMFGPPSLLAIQVVPTSEDNPQGGHGFYVRAEHTPLPTHASDMLALRTGQLRARGLSPRKTRGLVGRSDRNFHFSALTVALKEEARKRSWLPAEVSARALSRLEAPSAGRLGQERVEKAGRALADGNIRQASGIRRVGAGIRTGRRRLLQAALCRARCPWT